MWGVMALFVSRAKFPPERKLQFQNVQVNLHLWAAALFKLR